MPSDKRNRQREGRLARQAAEEAARQRAARRRTAITAVVIVALVVGVAALVSGGGGKKKTKVSSTNTTKSSQDAAGAPTCPNADGTSPRTTKFSKPPPMCIDVAKRYTAEVATSKGSFTLSLDPKRAPKTVNNFVFLARYHFYDGTPFHRVIPGFVVQGGDPQGTGTGGPGYTIPDEFPKAGEYKVGSVAMANTGQPNSGGSQFFVVTGDQGVSLPPQYTLFGEVASGMDVVKQIEALGDPSGKPRELVKADKVTIKEE